MNDYKLIICAVASVLAHFAIARGLDQLPPRLNRPLPQQIEVRVIEPEPPKEPEKPPEPKPPETTPQVHDAPRARPVRSPVLATVPKDSPPPDHPAVTVDSDAEPVYGITMESTSPDGRTGMGVGNTLKPGAGSGSGAPVKLLATPVAAFEVTKMPEMDERCRFGLGKYTDEALAAGIEGSVVFDVIVGEDGRVRDVKLVEGLGHGLTDAAMQALRACKFTPGEKDGKLVPVRIRGFKVTFRLPGGN